MSCELAKCVILSSATLDAQLHSVRTVRPPKRFLNFVACRHLDRHSRFWMSRFWLSRFRQCHTCMSGSNHGHGTSAWRLVAVEIVTDFDCSDFVGTPYFWFVGIPTESPRGFYNRKSCRRETALCFVSLNISLSHSRSRPLDIRSFEMTPLCQGMCKFLLTVFHSNCVYLVTFLRYSASTNGVTMKIWVSGRLRSLKISPFDRPCMGKLSIGVVQAVISA